MTRRWRRAGSEEFCPEFTDEATRSGEEQLDGVSKKLTINIKIKKSDFESNH